MSRRPEAGAQCRRLREGLHGAGLQRGTAAKATRNGSPAARLVLTILAGVATWERELMLERQCEGIAEAKAATKVGRRAFQIQGATESDGGCRRRQVPDFARSSVYRCSGNGGSRPGPLPCPREGRSASSPCRPTLRLRLAATQERPRPCHSLAKQLAHPNCRPRSKEHPDYALPSVTKHLIAGREFCVVS